MSGTTKNSSTNSGSGTSNTISPSSSPATSMSSSLDFPSVLHFLQREYRKMESERQLWELERTEYKRTIHFLESSRKSHEKIQFDLLRRIKMLEFVLQNERLKFNTLADEIKNVSNDDNSNNTNSIESVREQLINRVEQLITNPPVATATTTTATTNNNNNQSVASQYMNMEYPPKSAQMLRKCLDDLDCSDVWSVLSSVPSAANLPVMNAENTGATSLSRFAAMKQQQVSGSGGSGDELANHVMGAPDTTRIVVSSSSNVESQTNAPSETNKHNNGDSLYDEDNSHVNSHTPTSPISAISTPTLPTYDLHAADHWNQQDATVKSNDNKTTDPLDEDSLSEQMARKFPSLSRYSSGSMKKSKKKKSSERSIDMKLEPNNVFGKYQDTVSQDAEAFEDMEQQKRRRSEVNSLSSSSSSSIAIGSLSSRIWKPKYVLSSHLDSVRSLCFHKEEPVLITASEDWTLKMWNTDKLGKKSMDPVHTFRAHTGAVFTVTCNDQFIFSAGEDTTVRVWNFPPFDHDPYTNHGYASPFESLSLSGHDDAVWSVSVSGNSLLSASSDETIRVWSLSKIADHTPIPNYPSPSSNDHFLQNVIQLDNFVPTCVTALPNDPSRFVVSSTSGELALVDIETGKALWRNQIASTRPDTSKLIYKVVAHGSLPLLATGCEDSKIRFHDFNGNLTISENNVLGHSDAVSALDFSPCGQYLMSGGYDCSLRIWDVHSRNCVQEIPTHRRKYAEGIHDVAYHPSKSLVASCGADSLAKIYQ